MSECPSVMKHEWIRVGNLDCVVANILDPENKLGDLEVVFNSDKPTNRNVFWDGEHWKFVETGDYGGYADRYARLNFAVSVLKRGRYA